MSSRAALKIIPAATLFVSEPHPSMFGNDPNEDQGKNPAWTNNNWLKSRFHFSFAEYHDVKRSHFGVLRVMNDDLVQPARGFGTHPHRDMEIATYIVHGRLSHADSMGTDETLARGSVQFMTAGTGIQHSEFNRDKTSDLRFIQMWILPRRSGLKPNYGSFSQKEAAPPNVWRHLVSDVENRAATEAPVKINQDANIFVVETVEPGRSVSFPVAEGRQAYALCVEADKATLSTDGDKTEWRQHDAAHLYGPCTATFDVPSDATKPGHFLVVEMSSGTKDEL